MTRVFSFSLVFLSGLGVTWQLVLITLLGRIVAVRIVQEISLVE